MGTHIHRSGPVSLEQVEVHLTSSVPTATINPGDLVFAAITANVSYVKPVTAMTWNTDLATTQADLTALLLGVASGRSRIGSTDTRDLKVLVNMEGVYEMEAVSGTYEVGQYVGCAKDTGNALLNKVTAVATKSLAVGVVVENTVSAATRIKVRLLNTPPLR
jgi:hypothetical protein